MGYPSVTDRLHTRYSPVRRSPARYCYLPLPLDLHVLSLSLAFILSQDQTLHGIQIFVNPIIAFFVSLARSSRYIGIGLPLAASFKPFNFLKELFFLHSHPTGAKADAKITSHAHLFQIFYEVFSMFCENIFPHALPQLLTKTKKGGSTTPQK